MWLKPQCSLRWRLWAEYQANTPSIFITLHLSAVLTHTRSRRPPPAWDHLNICCEVIGKACKTSSEAYYHRRETGVWTISLTSPLDTSLWIDTLPVVYFMFSFHCWWHSQLWRHGFGLGMASFSFVLNSPSTETTVLCFAVHWTVFKNVSLERFRFKLKTWRHLMWRNSLVKGKRNGSDRVFNLAWNPWDWCIKSVASELENFINPGGSCLRNNTIMSI